MPPDFPDLVIPIITDHGIDGPEVVLTRATLRDAKHHYRTVIRKAHPASGSRQAQARTNSKAARLSAIRKYDRTNQVPLLQLLPKRNEHSLRCNVWETKLTIA